MVDDSLRAQGGKAYSHGVAMTTTKELIYAGRRAAADALLDNKNNWLISGDLRSNHYDVVTLNGVDITAAIDAAVEETVIRIYATNIQPQRTLRQRLSAIFWGEW
jgi:hypothetical protein